MPTEKLILMLPQDGETKPGNRMEGVLKHALEGVPFDKLTTVIELKRELKARDGYRRILFAVPLGKTGINMEYYRLIRFLREDKEALKGFFGGVLVDGEGELYTKSAAAELVLAANLSGCGFIGKPLIEGTGTLDNFFIIAGNMESDLLTAYKRSAALMVRELLRFEYPNFKQPNLLVLHASSHEASNTFNLWSRVEEGLSDFLIRKIGLRNGTLSDCSGCPYKMCLHFGEKGSCFYGGVMVDDVYPAVRNADAILLLCPNYNDALSANLTAFINRLTALFRTSSFNQKALYALVVSGYSGGDIVARQLICALNMNKGFYLPGNFAMLETANNAGTVLSLPGIEERITVFTNNLKLLSAKTP